MLQAVENGSVASVLYCMSLKAQVNCINPNNGDTPLHLAVALTRPNVFGFLLLVRELITFCLISLLLVCSSTVEWCRSLCKE